MKTIHLSVVAYLPKNIRSEAKKMTNFISKKFNTFTSKEKWDPHLTIGSGLYVPKDSLNNVFNDFQKLTRNLKKAKIQIHGIGFMDDFSTKFAKYPYVIFMKVILNKNLQKLFETLESYKKFRRGGYRIKKYTPHVTLAYDDFNKTNFEKALKFFKKINYNPKFEFSIDNISLVSFSETENRWIPLKRFKLKFSRLQLKPRCTLAPFSHSGHITAIKEERKKFTYRKRRAIDWHIHTTASDGRLTPKQIVHEAKKANLKEIAITDHDAISGIKEAQNEGKKLGVNVIAGVEFTCYDGNIEVHIKGLNIDYTNLKLLKICKEASKYRLKRAQIIVQKLKKLGYDIKWERVKELTKEAVGRGQIIMAFMENKKNLEKLQKTYNIQHRPTGKDVINYLIREGKPAYAKKAPLKVSEAIKAIHDAGGIAELSHPGGEKNITQEISYEKIKEYNKKGLDALEVYYGEHTLDLMKKYERIAKKLGLIITGGTDYHGIPDTDRKIGIGNIHKVNLSRFWKKD